MKIVNCIFDRLDTLEKMNKLETYWIRARAGMEERNPQKESKLVKEWCGELTQEELGTLPLGVLSALLVINPTIKIQQFVIKELLHTSAKMTKGYSDTTLSNYTSMVNTFIEFVNDNALPFSASSVKKYAEVRCWKTDSRKKALLGFLAAYEEYLNNNKTLKI